MRARIHYNPNPAWPSACWVILNVVLYQSWSLSSSKYLSLGSCQFCYMDVLGFGVWWKGSSTWTFFAKKHLQQYNHLVKVGMMLFAATPPLTPPGILEEACRLLRDIRRGRNRKVISLAPWGGEACAPTTHTCTHTSTYRNPAVPSPTLNQG